MKKILLGLSVLLLFTGCSKLIEKIKEDKVVDAMVDGQWVITHFTQDATDLTASFSDYKFQYYRNKTVDAIKNGAVEKTGTWDGDADNMIMTANFAAATDPLVLLNGSWHIDNNSWTFVEASQTVNGHAYTLRLDKQ